MTDLDQKILAALKETHGDLEETYREEPGLFALIGESFKGRFRAIVMIAFLFILIFLGLTIYCAVQMLGTTDLGLKINWLAGAFGSLIAVALLRLWYFMELNRLSLHHEIKRLELLLASMARQLG